MCLDDQGMTIPLISTKGPPFRDLSPMENRLIRGKLICPVLVHTNNVPTYPLIIKKKRGAGGSRILTRGSTLAIRKDWDDFKEKIINRKENNRCFLGLSDVDLVKKKSLSK